MSNSPLVSYTCLSPHRNHPRNHVIDTVTIHCMAGDMSVETCGAMFQNPNRKGSSNYGIGSDGRIALYVDEGDRSWCSDSRSNDHRAITIEVACEKEHPYAITDKAMEALLDLLTDICRRNPGIGRLRWAGKKSLIGQVDKQNMTVHRWFIAKACPGDYLYERHGQIAAEVNKRLDAEEKKEEVMDKRIYGTLKDVPMCYQPTIRKLMEAGAMVGYDPKDYNTIEDNVINVTEDFCRILAVLDRLGVLGMETGEE